MQTRADWICRQCRCSGDHPLLGPPQPTSAAAVEAVVAAGVVVAAAAGHDWAFHLGLAATPGSAEQLWDVCSKLYKIEELSLAANVAIASRSGSLIHTQCKTHCNREGPQAGGEEIWQ